MDEKKPKKREWVKNAAIIFLAVMLVLTFFSNTILNRTLPEVTTRYVEPNSIDAKVRISGTVSARENYDVIIDQTRKVAAVNVKLGQDVSTGDVLFTLESGDSEELEQAKKELEQAQRDYQRFLLDLDYSKDYTRSNREIEQLRADLDKAIKERDALPVPTKEALDAAAAAIEQAQAFLDNLAAQIKAGNKELTEAQHGVEESSDGKNIQDSDEYQTWTEKIREKEAEKAQARKHYLAAMDTFEREYRDLLNDILDGYDYDERLQENERDFVISMVDELFWLNVIGYKDESIINRYNADRALLNEIQQELREEHRSFGIVTLQTAGSGKNESDSERKKRILNETTLRTDYAEKIRQSLATDDIYRIATDVQIAAYRIISDTQQNYLEAADQLRDEQENFNAWIEQNPGTDAVKYNGKSHTYWVKEADRLKEEINELTYRQEVAQDDLQKATEAQDALKKQQDAVDEANAGIEALQKTLADRIFDLAQTQKEDQKTIGKQQQRDALTIQERQEELAELQKKIDEFSGSEATEVKAKVNGTVAALSVSAGHKAEAGATLATIEVKDLGYTMTATVSVDQAKLLHVGDTANVSNYYWGSRTTAVLSGMQPDPKDPRTSRVLTFDLAGDVNAGDQISFSIGERNASYDLVVPNSALRSDTSGSFVLIITAKNSPLGNRYFATRVDVEVIASDDYNTAVKGELSNMDSVITTSSGNAPVKNGDQVRLADTNNG